MDSEYLSERRRHVSAREKTLWIRARTTEEMLERSLEANRAVAWTWNLATGRVTRSKTASRVYGLSGMRHLGRGLHLVHPADLAAYKAVVADAVRRRGSYTTTFRIVRPIDGKVLWIEESGRFLQGAGPRLVVGLSVDVSERQAAEQRRRLENAALRLLTGRPAVPDTLRQFLVLLAEELKFEAGVVWELDFEKEVLAPTVRWEADGLQASLWADARRRRLCRRGEGPAGLAWARGRASWIGDLKTAAAPGEPAAGGKGFRCALAVPILGRRRIIGALELLGRAAEAPTPRVAETLEALGRQLGQFLERRRAEDELRRKQREEQLILDTVPAMIWYKDAGNRVLRCNRAAAAWIGKEPAEVEGRPLEELMPERAAEFHARDLEVIRTGKPKLGLLEESAGPDGRRCWLRRDVIPYESLAGRVEGVVVFVVDVTAAKRAEALEAERERQKEFLANVSHEFRTPIAAIKGFADTLLRGGWKDPRNRKSFVRIIGRHAERLSALVEDLLTLAAFDRGTSLKRETSDVAALVREHVEGLEPVFRRKGLRPVLQLRGAKVAVDPDFFRHLLDNLLSNAIKFSPPGGRVWIEARREGTEVRLSVRDEGVGISADHLPQVFDRFFRVEKKAERGNSGLGLYIVKRIVDAHGGRVWVESKLGHGSTFHVALPLHAAAPARGQASTLPR